MGEFQRNYLKTVKENQVEMLKVYILYILEKHLTRRNS